MKKIVLNVCLLFVSSLAFFSCLDDKDNVLVSYGVIQNVTSDNTYEILTDKGNTLVVTKSHTSHKIENDKRVLANFEILSEENKGKNEYEVEVNGFYNLVSKPILRESFIQENEEARRDSIGNDPFQNLYAWIGGGYLNINFNFLYMPYGGKIHMINLVYNDVQQSTGVNSDTLNLKFYHNAYGETPEHYYHDFALGLGRGSFNLLDLVPSGVESIPVKLTWDGYGYSYDDRKQHVETFVFTPGDNTGLTDNSVLKAGYDSSVETIQ